MAGQHNKPKWQQPATAPKPVSPKAASSAQFAQCTHTSTVHAQSWRLNCATPCQCPLLRRWWSYVLCSAAHHPTCTGAVAGEVWCCKSILILPYCTSPCRMQPFATTSCKSYTTRYDQRAEGPGWMASVPCRNARLDAANGCNNPA